MIPGPTGRIPSLFGLTVRRLCLGLLAAAGGVGCNKGTPQVAPAETPVIPISQPVDRVVTDFVDFTGRIEAVHNVSIVPRVTGFLMKMPFQEGSEVSKGDLLFEIDPRPYQAQYDQALSQVTLYEAQLELAKSTLARYTELDKNTPGAVSKLELEQYKASVVEAEARVSAAKKSLEVYQLNRDFTQVMSPIDGRVSKYILTRGNLVNQDQTLLTTVVSLDPIYASFDMDEVTLVKLRQALKEGKLKLRGSSELPPVNMGLQSDTGYPYTGTLTFVNNQVNSGTGSISMRGTFVNPLTSNEPIGWAASSVAAAAALSQQGPFVVIPELYAAKNAVKTNHLFSPGMFARIRLPIGDPHQALLVDDRIIQSDQGHKYVFVVDAQNKAQVRRINVGALQPDGLRVVEPSDKPDEGLKADDWVVSGALQQVKPRMELRPEKRPMRSIGSPAPNGKDPGTGGKGPGTGGKDPGAGGKSPKGGAKGTGQKTKDE